MRKYYPVAVLEFRSRRESQVPYYVLTVLTLFKTTSGIVVNNSDLCPKPCCSSQITIFILNSVIISYVLTVSKTTRFSRNADRTNLDRTRPLLATEDGECGWNANLVGSVSCYKNINLI